MTKTLLLISDQPEDISFIAEICQVINATLHLEPDPKKAVEVISALSPSVIFLNVDQLKTLHEFEMDAQQRLGLLKDHVQASRFHFFANQPLEQNRDVTQSPYFGSYFEKPLDDLEEKASFYGRFVAAGEQKATHHLSNFLGPLARVQTLNLTHSDQRQGAVEAVRQYLVQVKLPARISNEIVSTVETLLEDAIYKTPMDRSGSRELKDRERVSVKIGFDGLYIGISVCDPFGNLDRARLLSQISMESKSQKGANSAYQSGATLIYHCKSGESTDATLLYRVFPNYDDFKNQFHFFSAKFYG